MSLLVGQGGYVSLCGITKHVVSWNATASTSYDETTSTGDGGYYTDVPCISSLSGSLTVKNDSALIAAMATAAAPGLTGIVNLFHNTSGKSVNCPVCRIDGWTMTQDAKLVEMLTINFHASGTFTLNA